MNEKEILWNKFEQAKNFIKKAYEKLDDAKCIIEDLTDDDLFIYEIEKVLNSIDKLENNEIFDCEW